MVSTHPDHGSSVQLLPPLSLLFNELAGVAAVADGGGPACAVVWEVVPTWEVMLVLGTTRHDGRVGGERAQRRWSGSRIR